MLKVQQISIKQILPIYEIVFKYCKNPFLLKTIRKAY